MMFNVPDISNITSITNATRITLQGYAKGLLKLILFSFKRCFQYIYQSSANITTLSFNIEKQPTMSVVTICKSCKVLCEYLRNLVTKAATLGFVLYMDSNATRVTSKGYTKGLL